MPRKCRLWATAEDDLIRQVGAGEVSMRAARDRLGCSAPTLKRRAAVLGVDVSQHIQRTHKGKRLGPKHLGAREFTDVSNQTPIADFHPITVGSDRLAEALRRSGRTYE